MILEIKQIAKSDADTAYACDTLKFIIINCKSVEHVKLYKSKCWDVKE